MNSITFSFFFSFVLNCILNNNSLQFSVFSVPGKKKIYAYLKLAKPKNIGPGVSYSKLYLNVS